MTLTSITAIEAAFAPETAATFLILAEFSHDDLAQTIRVANNRKDVTSNGNAYTGVPFSIRLITDDERPPRGEIEVQNVGGPDKSADEDPDAAPVTPRVSEIVMPLRGPIAARFLIVLASSPDVIEEEFNDLVLRDVSADSISVRAAIVSRFYDREPATKYRIRQEVTPGAYV